MIETIEQNKCTGCKMCADVCPVNAITFRVNDEGFWYPEVNNAKCIKCGLCVKKCPSINPSSQQGKHAQVYAAWSKNEDTRITSTSGGVFWEVAASFIADGGVVVGCRYGNDWKSAYHTIAHDFDELLAIKGSKYFQSDTAGIYKATKSELDTNKKVLFCGTPCQVAALKSFLGKEYENLYCMDFICRSVNSPKAFKAYIDELEKEYNSNVVEVHLKNKKYGWQSLASQIKFKNGEESIRDKNEDWWVKGFVFNDLYTRDSCFECQYKVLPRVNADITIGDFWGIKSQSKEDLFKGISVVLINTEKGKKVFDQVREKFVCQRHTIKEVLPGNRALLYNPIRSDKKTLFFQLLQNHSFSYAVKECIKTSTPNRIKKTVARLAKTPYRVVRKCFGTLRGLLSNDISLPKYLRYNYFSSNIIRKDGARILPFKGAVLDIDNSARIVLSGKDLRLNAERMKGSKAECYVRLGKNAVWNCNNGGYLFYNSVLEIKEGAVFDSGYFSANGGSVIIAHKRINFGEDVMIGRNVIIYDSDFHAIYDKNGFPCNPPQPVNIEDHVWLTSNIVVQKGVTIGKNSLITAFTTVNKNVPEHTIYGGHSVGAVVRDYVEWGRESCPM